MLTIDAIKNLAVALGCATDTQEITADNVADVIQFMADAKTCYTSFSITPDKATLVVKKGTDTVHPDANGVYRLCKGSYTYSITAQDYTSITDKALTISDNDVTAGTKTVTEAMTRVNSVVSFATTPATGVTIVVKKGTEVQTPDASGKYHLPAESYTYTATAEGYTTQTDVELVISSSDVTTGTKTVTVTMVEG